MPCIVSTTSPLWKSSLLITPLGACVIDRNSQHAYQWSDPSTALPDGTYLIVNGAHQGVAGFGLATDPNYSALLYDPTQPVGQRFSILGNTIVARLYHSEATVSVASKPRNDLSH